MCEFLSNHLGNLKVRVPVEGWLRFYLGGLPQRVNSSTLEKLNIISRILESLEKVR